MKVNIENCVAQLGSYDGHDNGRRFAVGEMIKHLKQLRDRTADGDYTALDEFFGIYVFDGDKQPYKRTEAGGSERGQEVKLCKCLPSDLCSCEAQQCPGCSARDDEIAEIKHERDQYDARRRELVTLYEAQRVELRDAKKRIKELTRAKSVKVKISGPYGRPHEQDGNEISDRARRFHALSQRSIVTER